MNETSGDDQRLAAREKDRGHDDGQDVQEIEGADDAAGKVDQQRDQQDVKGQLDGDQRPLAEQPRQGEEQDADDDGRQQGGQDGQQRQRRLEEQQDDARDQGQGREDGDADGMEQYQPFVQLALFDGDQLVRLSLPCQ